MVRPHDLDGRDGVMPLDGLATNSAQLALLATEATLSARSTNAETDTRVRRVPFMEGWQPAHSSSTIRDGVAMLKDLPWLRINAPFAFSQRRLQVSGAILLPLDILIHGNTITSMPRAATTSDPFNAIAEPHRRDILEFLASRGTAVTDVVLGLRLAQPSVSKHLRYFAMSAWSTSGATAGRPSIARTPRPSNRCTKGAPD